MPKLKGIVERARECYKLVSESESEQRKREREDLEFQVAENQWSPEARAERRGGVINGVNTPARPMLSIDQIKHPIQLVNNSFVKSKLSVILHPISADASSEGAEYKQGLYRRIERDSNATQPRAWALNRAVKAGRGAYRITTEYDEDGDDPFDQEIRIRRILYQQNVYWDPAAVEPDLSDARWVLYVAWKDAEAFKDEFPGASLSKASSALDWAPFESEAPEWVRKGEDGEKDVLVAEYWWKEIEKVEIPNPDPEGKPRTRDEVTVYCAKINGGEVLEPPYRWPGKYLPFVPVFGEELVPVETERRYQGMIRPARDAQQAFNYGFSALLERAAMEPKTPYLADPKQIEGYEAQWAQANNRNYPWLPYNSIVGGQVVGPPQRSTLDTTGLSIAQIVLSTAKDGVQSATAIFDPGLGALPERRDAQSGRAIVALQQQGEAGTGQFVSGMAEVSMRYEALCIIDLLPHIYDRAGRVTRILTGEDDEKAIMLGAPFVDGPQGMPMPAPNHPEAKTIDLSKGKYGISISVGKNPQTSLEAGQQFLAEVVASAPDMMGVIGDLVFKYRDEPSAKEISERMKKVIQGQHPEFFDEGKGSPEQAQAELQALKGQMQQLTEQAKAMDEALKTKQVEQQAQIQIAQMKGQIELQLAQLEAERDLQKAQMDNAAKIEVARITAAQKAYDAEAARQEEMLATGLEIEAELAQTAVEHEHEERMADKTQEHEGAMAIQESEEAPEPPEGASAESES